VERKKDAARLVIEPFEKLRRADRADIVREGAELLRFLAPDAKHDVAIVEEAQN
jgi:hypothetical protein